MDDFNSFNPPEFNPQPLYPPPDNTEISYVSAEEKFREKTDFKKVLLTLGMSYVAAEAIKYILSVMFGYALYGSGLIYYGDKTPTWYPLAKIADIIGKGSFIPVSFGTYYYFVWTVSDIIVYGVPIILFALMLGKYIKKSGNAMPAGYKPNWILPFFLATYSAITISNIANRILADVIDSVFGTGGLRDVFSDVPQRTVSEISYMVLIVAIIGPICEEVIFRHCLLKPLRRFGDKQAVLITALMFGMFHENLTQFLYAFTGGILLGILAVKANSVIPSIIVHMMNNGFDIFKSVLYDLSYRKELPFSADMLSLLTWGVIIAGIIVLLTMFTKDMLKIGNDNPYLTTRERAKTAASHPAIIVTGLVLVYLVISGS